MRQQNKIWVPPSDDDLKIELVSIAHAEKAEYISQTLQCTLLLTASIVLCRAAPQEYYDPLSTILHAHVSGET